MYSERRFFWLTFLSLSVICLSGCATVKTKEPKAQILPKQGIYHKVHAGETIWSIAKAYRVSVQDVIHTNQIPNVAHIEKDQLIFIPGVDQEKKVSFDKEALKGTEFGWPVKGKILSYFGDRRDFWVNNGIDIEVHEGQEVIAARHGEVVFADYLSGYNYTVILDHNDGFFTVYSRNSDLLVKAGDQVAKDAPIAKVGRSGQLAFLHFEIRKNGAADNPLYYLP